MFRSTDFSERLQLLRKSNNLTLEQLATALSIVKQTLSNYENRNRAPSLEASIIIADYFCVSLDYLTGRSDDPQQELFLSKTKLELRKQICSLDDLDLANNLFDVLLVADSSKIKDQICIINSVKDLLSPQPNWTASKPAQTINKAFEKIAHALSPDFLLPKDNLPQDCFHILGTKVTCHYGFWIENHSEELRPAKRHRFLIIEDSYSNLGYLSRLFFSNEFDRDEFPNFLIEIKQITRRIAHREQAKVEAPRIIVKTGGEFKEVHIEKGVVTLLALEDAEQIAEWVLNQDLRIADI